MSEYGFVFQDPSVGGAGHITDIVSHPVTSGVLDIRVVAYGALTLSAGAIPLARDPDGEVVLAANGVGFSKIVCFTDSSSLHNAHFGDVDNAKLWENAVKWLCVPFPTIESVTDMGTVMGGLSAQVSVEVRNERFFPVEVTIRISNGAFTAVEETITVDPGTETFMITVGTSWMPWILGAQTGTVELLMDGEVMATATFQATVIPLSLIIIVIIVIVVIVVALRRRRPTPPPPYVAPPPTAATKHCTHCGAEMAVEATFCPKCGAKQ